MEELSIEEKAKRYDEAIAVINKSVTDKYGCIIGIKPSDIFPELKENEDERIRKAIITLLQDVETDEDYCGINHIKEYIAWLEKQGEQKPTWSEEDERMYKAISIALTFKDAKVYLSSWYTTPEEADNWLKSLKERFTWKPSDEQINALDNARHSNPFDIHILDTLFHDLKELRKE